MSLTPTFRNHLLSIRERQSDMSGKIGLVDMADFTLSWSREWCGRDGGESEECLAVFFEDRGFEFGGGGMEGVEVGEEVEVGLLIVRLCSDDRPGS